MSRPDEKGLGVPLPHFTLKTVVAPDLQGVDAFDRSAVEEGKVLARQYHGEKASGGAQ
jgi:glucose-6-phosphate isomerase